MILVTGSAGFIGSNFLHHCITDGRAAFGVDIREATFDLLGETHVGDICDRAVVDGFVSQVERVVHFAAETHNDWSLREPQKFIDTNIVGTSVLLEACKQHGVAFHHVSTDEVFGDLPLQSDSKFSEDTPYKPSSPYSASKAASDHLVRAWSRSFGLTVTLSNCSNNYGPMQSVEKFIPRQITNILQGRKPKLYGSGQHVRDWIYVDDHNRAVLDIIDKGVSGETYLIGADGQLTNLEVMKQILKIMGKPVDWFEVVADRPGHDLRYAIDSSKLRNSLGWEPEFVDFTEGLEQTICWYDIHRDWWLDDKLRIEADYASH